MNTTIPEARPPRSKLFVPGSRPELFPKAFQTAADAICFDLEDGVAPDRKDFARAAVSQMLERDAPFRRQTIIVRANAMGCAEFEHDLQAVTRNGIDILTLPKVEGPHEIAALAERLTVLEKERGIPYRIRIHATIETPQAVSRAAEIAAQSPRIAGLALGLGDLFESLGIARSSESAVNHVRLLLRMAGAEAGVPVFDAVFTDIEDEDGFRREARSARNLGFAGKSCIHPKQVPIANEVFRPSLAEIERARRVLETAGEKLGAGLGAFTLNGEMIDAPFIERARVIIAQAREIEQHESSMAKKA